MNLHDADRAVGARQSSVLPSLSSVYDDYMRREITRTTYEDSLRYYQPAAYQQRWVEEMRRFPRPEYAAWVTNAPQDTQDEYRRLAARIQAFSDDLRRAGRHFQDRAAFVVTPREMHLLRREIGPYAEIGRNGSVQVMGVRIMVENG